MSSRSSWGRSFVISVRHGEAPDLGHVRRTLEARPDAPRARPDRRSSTASLDHVVDCYQPVVAGLENDIDEIEDEVFSGSATVSRRTYELTREVIEFQRATKPLASILARLIDLPDVDDEERRYLRNVQDHAVRIEEQVDGFRVLLQNILSVHLTLETKALTEVSIHQNEQVQKISAWAAILFAPTLIGTIYGMNFDHMPELHWRLGYPMAIALMLAVSIALYVDLQAPALDLTDPEPLAPREKPQKRANTRTSTNATPKSRQTTARTATARVVIGVAAPACAVGRDPGAAGGATTRTVPRPFMVTVR